MVKQAISFSSFRSKGQVLAGHVYPDLSLGINSQTQTLARYCMNWTSHKSLHLDKPALVVCEMVNEHSFSSAKCVSWRHLLMHGFQALCFVASHIIGHLKREHTAGRSNHSQELDQAQCIYPLTTDCKNEKMVGPQFFWKSNFVYFYR